MAAETILEFRFFGEHRKSIAQFIVFVVYARISIMMWIGLNSGIWRAKTTTIRYDKMQPNSNKANFIIYFYFVNICITTQKGGRKCIQ